MGESVKSWDTDIELKLFCKSYWIQETKVSSVIKLRNCTASINTIHNFLSHGIIGLADQSTLLKEHVVTFTNQVTVEVFVSLLKDFNNQQLNQTLSTSAPILQHGEFVQFAFKHG